MARTSSVDTDLAELGRFIRARRTSLQLTQAQLGNLLGWGQERISTLEHGKYGTPSLPVLARLADALACSLADLLAAAGYHVGDSAITDLAEGDRPEVAALFYALEQLLQIDSIEPSEALTQASTILSEVMGADKVDVFLPDESTRSLVAVGASNTPLARLEHEHGLNRLPIAHGGQTAWVFTTGQSYHTGRADQDPEVLPGVVKTLGIRSVVDVPLVIEGTTRGVVSVTSTVPDRFSTEDRRFVEAVARWVAIILHRAELIGRLESRRS